VGRHEEYFENHGVADKWPWSIYHKPIEDSVIEAVDRLTGSPKCLNIGCGLFDMYPRLKDKGTWYACDIDPRCVAEVSNRFPSLNASRCKDYPAYPDDFFDFVYATEVLEHITQPIEWLEKVLRITKPGGLVLLSTPNYGVSMLPVLEYSVLEVIARSKGFSRFGIHPNKYSKTKLNQHISQLGPLVDSHRVYKTSYGMVLIAEIKKGV